MKKFLFIFTIVLLSVACKNQEKEVEIVPTEDAVAIQYQAFGDKIDAQGALPSAIMAKKFNDLKVGDTLQVKFAATVVEVCQKKGCWMNLDLNGQEAMVRFKDYAFFMPKDIAGREVIVNGKAYVEEMSVEDQRHYAEDAGKPADEIAAITQPKRSLSFEADGVLVPQVEKQ